MTPLTTGLILAVAAAIIGLFVWSVQRIIGRIDSIGDKLEVLGTRVTWIEAKQDVGVKVARKTATKVGVRLPPELTDTIDPRLVSP